MQNRSPQSKEQSAASPRSGWSTVSEPCLSRCHGPRPDAGWNGACLASSLRSMAGGVLLTVQRQTTGEQPSGRHVTTATCFPLNFTTGSATSRVVPAAAARSTKARATQPKPSRSAGLASPGGLRLPLHDQRRQRRAVSRSSCDRPSRSTLRELRTRC